MKAEKRAQRRKRKAGKLHTYTQAMESAKVEGSVPGASIFEDQDEVQQ